MPELFLSQEFVHHVLRDVDEVLLLDPFAVSHEDGVFLRLDLGIAANVHELLVPFLSGGVWTPDHIVSGPDARMIHGGFVQVGGEAPESKANGLMMSLMKSIQ